MLDMPQGDIGKKFNRDHSTVIHSTRTVEAMLEDNMEVQSDVERLMKIIRES
jgi:chromosomal replication initiator protein